MIKKLRIKFICINMLLVTLMLGLIFSMVFFFTRKDLEEDSIAMMQEIAASPMQQFQPGATGSDLSLPYFTLELGRDGEILQTGGGFFDLSDDEMLSELLAAVRENEESTGVLPKYSLRYCEVYTPTGHYIVFADMSSEQNTINSLVRTCALIGLASLIVFLGISILLSIWAIRPVETAWKQQRQFVADASHELKTPLTVILTNAVMLQEYEQTSGGSTPFSENIVTMSQQMKELIENLLSLARVDNGIPKAEQVRLNFSEVVDNAILPFEALFYENGLELQTETEPNLFVTGSPTRMRQLIEIFLDNAQKYAPSGTFVRVSLRRTSGHCCLLTVSNPGDPLNKEQLENLFKRFYRMDEAHTRDGSYGLGLSIAEGIVTEHHGKIWAESENGITSFCVKLRLANGGQPAAPLSQSGI